MPEEVSKAEWISLSDLPNLQLTPTAQNVRNILGSLEAIKTGKFDLDKMPRGDLLDD